MKVIDTRGSQEIFTVNKFRECADTWGDTNNFPLDMLDIPRRGEVYKFIIGPFVFQNDEIDDAIENYDDKAMELKIFGKIINLDPDLVARAMEIPHRGGAMFNSKKAHILGTIEMANKICEKKVYVRMNGLKM